MAQLSGKSDNWSTPRYLYDQLEIVFGKFDFDPCPLRSNSNMALLDLDWNGNVFINPPYSNVESFLNKGLLELKKGNANQLVYLIIPRTSTKYWNEFVMKYAEAIYFIPYRLKFGSSKNSAPFPSCVVLFKNLNLKDFVSTYTWKLKRENIVKLEAVGKR